MRIRLLTLIAAIAAAAALASCGSSSDSGGSDTEPVKLFDVTSGPATIVPADTPVYFQAALQPGADRSAAIKDVVSKVSNGKVTEPGGEIFKAIEDRAGDNGDIDFDADIKPWLGKSAAVFSEDLSADPKFAVVIESTDKTKAQAFVKKGAEKGDKQTSYRGNDLLIDDDTGVAVTEDFLLIGTGQRQPCQQRDF